MSVRLAVKKDLDLLVEHLRLKHSEDGLGIFDEDKTAAAIERGIVRDGAIVGVIRGGINVIEASIGLFMGAPWNSSDRLLTDRWLFVHPDHRRSEHAKNLLLFAKWAATKADIPLIMSVIINDETANKAMLFGRQIPKAGELFVFRPERSGAVAT